MPQGARIIVGICLAVLLGVAVFFGTPSAPTRSERQATEVAPVFSGEGAKGSAFLNLDTPALPYSESGFSSVRPTTEPPTITDWTAGVVREIAQPVPEIKLVLPSVNEKEMTVGEIISLMEYLSYVAEKGVDITFTESEYAILQKNGQSQYRLPIELVKASVEARSLKATEAELRVHQSYLGRKIGFFKSIPTGGEARELNRRMIGADLLTLELIAKALSTRNDWESLRIQSQRYEAAVLAEHEDLYQRTEKLGLLKGKRGVLTDILVKAGLIEEASAVVPMPFGGKTLLTVPCPCLWGGFSVSVGPPAPVPNAVMTPAFMLSPALFPFRNPAGQFMLGLYILFPMPVIPCISAPPFCVPTSNAVVIMAGTSV